MKVSLYKGLLLWFSVKNPPAIQETQETWVRSLGQEDPLEKGMATHASSLDWRIPCTEESGRLQSIMLWRVGHEWGDSTFSLSLYKMKYCSSSMVSSIFYNYAAAAAAKSLQSCPTLCDPIDGSPPGSSIPGILQARTLEWVATSFSNAWKWKVKGKLLSRVWLSDTMDCCLPVKGCCWMIRRRILGLRRRRIQSWARDEAGLLRAFV